MERETQARHSLCLTLTTKDNLLPTQGYPFISTSNNGFTPAAVNLYSQKIHLLLFFCFGFWFWFFKIVSVLNAVTKWKEGLVLAHSQLAVQSITVGGSRGLRQLPHPQSPQPSGSRETTAVAALTDFVLSIPSGTPAHGWCCQILGESSLLR